MMRVKVISELADDIEPSVVFTDTLDLAVLHHF